MKKVNYVEWENGSKCLAETKEEIEIIETLTKEEFKKRFPETSIYGMDAHMAVYLENGIICTEKDWNGERYTIKRNGKELEFRPVYKEIYEDDFEIIGYEEL